MYPVLSAVRRSRLTPAAVAVPVLAPILRAMRPRPPLVLALGASVLAALVDGTPGSGPRGHPCQGPDRAAASCGRCHDAVHAEWLDSAHARAFTDPVFQRHLATRNRPQFCLPCHVPESVPDRLGTLPRAREERRDEGVTCAACHLRGETVLGPHGGDTPAHALARDPLFERRGSTALCSSCHDTAIASVLPLGREFAASNRDGDESCIGCHMPSTRRPPARDPATGEPAGAVRGGRSHRLLGPGDPAFCASAFRFRLERHAAGLSVFLANGAGHGVPGLALRAFPVRLSLQDARGRELHAESLTISSENRLLVDEERRIALPAVEGAVALRVVVDHVFDGKRAATVVDQELELP